MGSIGLPNHCRLIGGGTMKYPEGRLVAIQQQLHFAKILADQLDLPHDVVLEKLALSGLRLFPDEQEISIDATSVLASIEKNKTGLRAVPDTEGN